MMCLHMGLFVSIVLHSRCVVFLSQETHLSVQFDYVYWLFPPFRFLCSCFLGPELFGCWSIWMSILILFPTPFPIFFISVFYSLLYLFIYNIIFLILNFYLGCLSLNLQGLILVFGSVCLSYYYHCSFYLVSCSCFIDAVLSIISVSLMKIFLRSILFSTWSFLPPATLIYLLEAFLR